jgi:hypothetical protein
MHSRAGDAAEVVHPGEGEHDGDNHDAKDDAKLLRRGQAVPTYAAGHLLSVAIRLIGFEVRANRNAEAETDGRSLTV